LFFGTLFVFWLQLVSSRFYLLLFLQYIFVKCRFGQQPFMNMCLKQPHFIQQPSICLELTIFCNFNLIFVLEKPIHLLFV
jgi:hypothetical protein